MQNTQAESRPTRRPRYHGPLLLLVVMASSSAASADPGVQLKVKGVQTLLPTVWRAEQLPKIRKDFLALAPTALAFLLPEGLERVSASLARLTTAGTSASWNNVFPEAWEGHMWTGEVETTLWRKELEIDQVGVGVKWRLYSDLAVGEASELSVITDLRQHSGAVIASRVDNSLHSEAFQKRTVVTLSPRLHLYLGVEIKQSSNAAPAAERYYLGTRFGRLPLPRFLGGKMVDLAGSRVTRLWHRQNLASFAKPRRAP